MACFSALFFPGTTNDRAVPLSDSGNHATSARTPIQMNAMMNAMMNDYLDNTAIGLALRDGGTKPYRSRTSSTMSGMARRISVMAYSKMLLELSLGCCY
jgi:hypothetical protein